MGDSIFLLVSLYNSVPQVCVTLRLHNLSTTVLPKVLIVTANRVTSCTRSKHCFWVQYFADVYMSAFLKYHPIANQNDSHSKYKRE